MCLCLCCFFFKQKTASELRISDGSSDVCSSDLLPYGLWIERDLSFKTTFPLTIWAEWARRAGSILWAETLLRRASQTGEDPDLPHRSSELTAVDARAARFAAIPETGPPTQERATDRHSPGVVP